MSCAGFELALPALDSPGPGDPPLYICCTVCLPYLTHGPLNSTKGILDCKTNSY